MTDIHNVSVGTRIQLKDGRKGYYVGPSIHNTVYVYLDSEKYGWHEFKASNVEVIDD